jgi:hypothetical protein
LELVSFLFLVHSSPLLFYFFFFPPLAFLAFSIQEITVKERQGEREGEGEKLISCFYNNNSKKYSLVRYSGMEILKSQN